MAIETPNTETGGQKPASGKASGNYSPDELKPGKATGATRGADVNLDLVLEVPVNVSLRVGSTDITIRDLVKLVEGSVIALDQEAGAPMDVLVNGTLIAHGEIVVVDERFGVRLTDVVSPVERIEKIN
jgi:flagellar motor switch protein FliN/FliY